MGKELNEKFTWVIKNFSSLQSENINSDQFVVGGCKWSLLAYPKGNNVDNYLYLFLEVADAESLPSGWTRHARYIFTLVNQSLEKPSRRHESQRWFDEKYPAWGRKTFCPLDEIQANDSGFLLNGELKIVAEVEVLEVIGKSDVSDTNLTMNLNGFLLLPSQVESVRRVFERHPEIVSEFRPKKASIRTAYMSLLLSLVETMCQLPQELSKDDLSDAYTVFGSLRDAGFKLDWLEKKLDEMWENKVKEEAGETRMQETEEKLNEFKQKCSVLEAQLEKEKSELSDDDLDEASVAVSYVAERGFKVDWLEKKIEEVKAKKKKVDTAKARLHQMELNKKCVALKSDVSAANVPLSFSDLL